MDERISLPRLTVNKIINRSMGIRKFKFTKKTREFITRCAEEFILMIGHASGENCRDANRKTILNTHVYQALEELGFAAYVDECKKVYSDYQEVAKAKLARQDKLKSTGLSIEELERQQIELFEAAKKKYMEEE